LSETPELKVTPTQGPRLKPGLKEHKVEDQTGFEGLKNLLPMNLVKGVKGQIKT